MEIDQNNIGENQTVVNNESGIVNINQSKQYTNLVDEDTLQIYKEISQAEQDKFLTGFVIACLIPCISFAADLMQIHPLINLPLWVYILAFSMICAVVIIGFYDNFKIFSSIPPLEDECRQLYSEKLFSRTKNGYIIFTHTKNCMHPKCKGKIVISTPPQRYNGEFSFFAKCSLAGEQHSYAIDYNFIAYPRDVDWRPMPAHTK